MLRRKGIAKISKALADPTRLKIFEAISHRGGTNCSELVSLRGVTPATVSHHLKVLSDAGLIECWRQGQFVHSKAVPKAISEFARALTKLVDARARK
jgi:ArsR family transcriptional regulator, arsenate/arsenite/antimonite-responsive transcriptional repressor